MKYGNVELIYLADSLVTITNKAQIIQHYSVTDISDKIPMGRQPTRIMCTLVAESESQRLEIEQMLHGEQEAELVIGSRYYKRVVTGDASPARKGSNRKWEFTAEFVCLDPVPYSTITNEPLY